MTDTETSSPLLTKMENRVALSTSLIAVALALSTIYSNSVHDDLLLAQGAANNAWSYFQSKSIKQNLYEVSVEQLQLESENEMISTSYKQKIQRKIEDFHKEIQRYGVEKKEIQQQAKKQESIAQKADQRGIELDLAEAFYQIAIILSAISLIARSKIMWVLGIVLGCAGVYFSVTAWLM
jgi:hypothetical protein